MARRNDELLFIAWSRLSRRTIQLASHLGAELLFIEDKPPYIRAWLQSKNIIERKHNKLKTVILQLPQGPLLLEAVILKNKYGFKLVADVHTGFIVYDSLRGFVLNGPFTKLLDKCDLVIVHNDHIKQYIRKLYGIDKKLITVYDPLPVVPRRLEKPKHLEEVEGGNFIVFPASWNLDEPLEYVISEYLSSKISSSYKLVITGKPRAKIFKKIEKLRTSSIILTGYLPWRQYYWLLANAKAIIAATKREYTILSAVWEGAASQTPLIVSRTRTLEELLRGKVLFFELRRGSLAEVLDQLDELAPAMREKTQLLKHYLLTLSRKSLKELSSIIS